MKSIQLPAQTVPVIDEADVVVVGGGTAGFIAATAAAKTGAKTILVERFGYLGGCTTAPYNTGIGWFGDADGNRIVQGFGWEFVQRMEHEGNALMRGHKADIWPPYTKKVALDMVTGAGVNLYFYTWASDVLTHPAPEGASIDGIVVQTKGGRSVILGRTFVDCSADADIAAGAGAPFEMENVDDLQQVSCDYIACGVDARRVREWAWENRDRLQIKESEFQTGHKDYGLQPMFSFTVPNEHTGTADGFNHHVGVMPTVKLCLYREAVRIQGNVEIDPLDPKALTYAEVEGMRGAFGHLQYLKENIPGFEGAFVAAQAHLGVRESRRIQGEYYLTIDDVKGQARFEDVVSLNARSLDYHLKGTVFKIQQLQGNHDVPLRALTPKGVENLVVAGRCISCDHLSHASLRGAGTCMGTGHAAGTTAALASAGTGAIRDLDVRHVQRTLLAQDAILSTVPGRRPWEHPPLTLREGVAATAEVVAAG